MSESRLRWVLRATFSSHRARLRAFWHFVVRRYAFEICMACGRPVGRSFAYRSYWWTDDDDLWLRVTGDPATIRCPSCFTAEAHAKGIFVRWAALEGFGPEVTP